MGGREREMVSGCLGTESGRVVGGCKRLMALGYYGLEGGPLWSRGEAGHAQF